MKLVSKYILAIVVLISSHNLIAQKNFKFGIKGAGGLSWNKPDNKQMKNEKAGLGYSYGLMGDYRLGSGNYFLCFGLEVLRLRNELAYTSDAISVRIPGEATSSGTDSTVFRTGSSIYDNTLGYVYIPFSLKMTTNEIGYMTYFAKFGFDLGVNIRSDADITSTTVANATNPIIIEEVDISGETQLFRLGLLIGGGFEFNLSGNTNLMVGLNYSNGFTNHFTKKKRNEADIKVENRTVVYDENGDLKYDAEDNLIIDGEFKKSMINNISLNVGVYF